LKVRGGPHQNLGKKRSRGCSPKLKKNKTTRTHLKGREIHQSTRCGDGKTFGGALGVTCSSGKTPKNKGCPGRKKKSKAGGCMKKCRPVFFKRLGGKLKGRKQVPSGNKTGLIAKIGVGKRTQKTNIVRSTKENQTLTASRKSNKKGTGMVKEQRPSVGKVKPEIPQAPEELPRRGKKKDREFVQDKRPLGSRFPKPRGGWRALHRVKEGGNADDCGKRTCRKDLNGDKQRGHKKSFSIGTPPPQTSYERPVNGENSKQERQNRPPPGDDCTQTQQQRALEKSGARNKCGRT